MIVDPQKTEPQNIYKLLIGSIIPRPIAFVSTLSPQGAPNLAPFSFFTAISANPPAIGFSPSIRPSDGGKKDTLRNVEATKEFVVNIVSEEFAKQMNASSAEYPYGVSEFEKTGLTPIPSDIVKPPRLKESHISMECKLAQIVTISEKILGGSFVIGEVVRFHVDDAFVNDFKIDPDKLHAIGRMGGQIYCRTTDRFEMDRPTKPAN